MRRKSGMSLEDLRAWCQEHGARIHGVRASSVQHGRGIIAEHDLDAGELILAVPGSLLISGRSARADPELSAALNSYPGITPVQVRRSAPHSCPVMLSARSAAAGQDTTRFSRHAAGADMPPPP